VHFDRGFTGTELRRDLLTQYPETTWLITPRSRTLKCVLSLSQFSSVSQLFADDAISSERSLIRIEQILCVTISAACVSVRLSSARLSWEELCATWPLAIRTLNVTRLRSRGARSAATQSGISVAEEHISAATHRCSHYRDENGHGCAGAG
jgi:hypothetical protein